MTMPNVLGFDVGATKVAWGVVTDEGTLLRSGRYPTPTQPAAFIKALSEVISNQKDVVAIGIGMPGTISTDNRSTVFCTNIPEMSEQPLAQKLEELHTIPVILDNDARCALIGEVWLGVAQELSSAVMVTLGTGIGGAVMQKGKVLPHPSDIQEEVSRILIDPTDVFPAKSGNGTVEAFLGGSNLEERFQVDLHEIAENVRKGDKEAAEVWHAISYYFIQCMKAIYAHYTCNTIIIGGIGSKDLKYYFQDPAPCTITAAKLGEKAALYGAARIALDLYQDQTSTDWD